MDMPIWIWFVFVGIVVSAIMAIRTARQERLIENTWIEEEGQKYMERMRIEQEKRKSDREQEYSQ
jgi:cell division protein FtsL